ncbi:helix-turn-helix domain-containing protein [Streptococcus suis]|uniref:helix-turn-helix domain-containing protein n=1 Tax=Streptococcus suis TaxID=1307 RepID=UPI003757D4C0
MTTVDKIKHILRKTGWTRDQFATEMGVTALSVYKWLDGRLPRQRMLDKIDELYEQTKDTKPKVLAQRGTIRILYPYYSHRWSWKGDNR